MIFFFLFYVCSYEFIDHIEIITHSSHGAGLVKIQATDGWIFDTMLKFSQQQIFTTANLYDEN